MTDTTKEQHRSAEELPEDILMDKVKNYLERSFQLMEQKGFPPDLVGAGYYGYAIEKLVERDGEEAVAERLTDMANWLYRVAADRKQHRQSLN